MSHTLQLRPKNTDQTLGVPFGVNETLCLFAPLGDEEVQRLSCEKYDELKGERELKRAL